MADKGLIEKSVLEAIAAAIRTKNGSSTTYIPSAMAAAIKAIKTGGVFKTGSFRNTSPSTNSYSVTHGLGKTPNFAFVYNLKGNAILRSASYGNFAHYNYVATNNTAAGIWTGTQNVTWDSTNVTFAGSGTVNETNKTISFTSSETYYYIIGVI